MERIKLVQVGMTHEHAGGKMATLRKMEDIFEIVGVVDDRETVQMPFYYNSIGKEYDGLRKMTMEEALADTSIQAALIEVPNNETVKTALPFMEKGLALHVEKPAGLNLEDYKKLLDGCKAKNLPFQMGFMFRGNPGFRFAANAVKSGWLGEIFEFTASMGHDYGNDRYHEYIHGMKGGQMYATLVNVTEYINDNYTEKIMPVVTERAWNICILCGKGMIVFLFFIIDYCHDMASLN